MDLQVLECVKQLAQGEQVALVSIVRTRGSSPRKAGAQILFYPDGRTVGTIGGGCGEAEVKTRALIALRSMNPEVYELNLSADIAEDEGMVCGGTMEVFIEPLKGSAGEPIKKE